VIPLWQNSRVAQRLDEVATLLAAQDASAFRVAAYRNAAEVVRGLPEPVGAILDRAGLEGLDRLPSIGPTIARAIRDLVETGSLPMLERLRGESDAVALLASVPGIGRGLAERLHHEHRIDTLEDLETAAQDGRLANVRLFGEKRLRGVREALAARLGRVPRSPPQFEPPPVDELLDVDREYRRRAAEGSLKLIAPRRFNPQRAAWLPVLHTMRGERHYTALYSTTARAHELGRTRDWVVIYVDGGRGERQYTAVTATRGPLRGKRVLRGREGECYTHYKAVGNVSGSSPASHRPVLSSGSTARVRS
jgi:DNA polymerase (family X)